MALFRLMSLPLWMAWTSHALRRKSQRDDSSSEVNTTAWSDTYPTTNGCECKDQCEGRVGTKWVCDTCKTKGRCGTFSVTGRWGYCDYSESTVESFIRKSSESKTNYFWERITADTTRYPKYPLLGNLLSSMRTVFDNYRPEMPVKREKMIHTVGSICKFKLQISGSSPYTGLLSPGLKTGFVRMGGALDPADGLTPGLGFKLPRSGVPDGDLVMLYSLAAGTQWDFFFKNQSNHLAPAEGFPTTLLAKKFEDASQCPYQVGLSDWARYSQDGSESNPPKFPFKLLMVAGPNVKTGTKGHTVDAVHSEIDAIPVGTTLYKVYACAKSAGDELMPSENLEACGGAMLLGSVKTASRCTTSYYGDKSFHIRHQRIEEDWILEPSYMKMGGYDANVACAKRVDARGAPPKCSEEGMLDNDA